MASHEGFVDPYELPLFDRHQYLREAGTLAREWHLAALAPTPTWTIPLMALSAVAEQNMLDDRHLLIVRTLNGVCSYMRQETCVLIFRRHIRIPLGTPDRRTLDCMLWRLMILRSRYPQYFPPEPESEADS